ncbi:XRE family transcriptional regulator [Clostridium sartagoforme]|uniref:XRE family transcriptional regulator n=1 Tax=Clostridium sartagoforme TaxID=84031 RepID=A0A4S2DHT8_9CLOT|nr:MULTISPECIES: helix-turn-helix transcriptional regulator [Clostridium]MBS5939091.1 helix-turn-helix transcriptional regulator [Clostridium sp.]TGY41688.1 XRE family transcriptional regulator [Clostridium sartagoforme]
MNLSAKLQLLRKKNGLSQEELAERLGISRQAISKWESGQSTPDLNKLILLSEIYNVTIDSLVKDSDEYDILQGSFNNNKIDDSDRKNTSDDSKNTQIVINLGSNRIEYEYKSKRTLFGLPLVHINLGRGIKKAKGIIAIGNISCGVVSVGLLSFGIFSFGVLSIGLVSIAAIAIGLLLGVGAIAIGTFSIGAISIGVFSAGALAIGKYAVGGGAIAADIAIGDHAKANIAIGNRVDGLRTLSLDSSKEEIKRVIKEEYPNIKNWIVDLVSYFASNFN